jgi:hypothetical protein
MMPTLRWPGSWRRPRKKRNGALLSDKQPLTFPQSKRRRKREVNQVSRRLAAGLSERRSGSSARPPLSLRKINFP